MGETRNAYRIWVGKPEGRRPLEKSRHRWILERWDGVVWAGLIWLRIGINGGLL
jgi:hypothetical protein